MGLKVAFYNREVRSAVPFTIMGVSRVVWRTLNDFGSTTSISGVNRAAKAKSIFRLLYWIIIFCGLVYVTISNLVSVITDFYEYPTVTTTNLTYRPNVIFPAVTVCNLNRFVRHS